MKLFIKKVLSWLGLYHPSLGIKISQEAKAGIILGYKNSLPKILVETGTQEGWMIDRVGDRFERVYSVEIDEPLYIRALERFRDERHIKLFSGDSAKRIPEILIELEEPALFWLDAHRGGTITAENSPIIAELEAIFNHHIKTHIILIDDARYFDIKTIKIMKKMAKECRYTFDIKDGIFKLISKNK